VKPLRLFVTGTDTGVGKTRVATALCRVFARRGARVGAMKPIASGSELTPEGLRNEDALALRAAMTVRAAYEEVNPYAFGAAVAPHIAARDAGTTIDFAVLDRAYERLCLQSDVLIVEGAGGWLVPIDAGRSFADLAQHWQLGVVLVIGMRLGCLNHALLTARAIAGSGLTLCGWVANRVEESFPRCEENLAFLRDALRAPCLGVVPHAPLASADTVADFLEPGELLVATM
jgi:dethiobiotin synthetase